MQHYTQKPLVLFPAHSELARIGISPETFRSFFPAYLASESLITSSLVKSLCMRWTQLAIQSVIKLVLDPRPGEAGDLDISEVDRVYDREARTYDLKHHLTTFGIDTTWRRLAGWCAASIAKNCSRRLNILDVCTGTGLTIVEIINVLSEWGMCADIVGIDYNCKMLAAAGKRRLSNDLFVVDFRRCNATSLYGPCYLDKRDDLTRFEEADFDLITQVFGIGGIDDPIAVFRGILPILRPEGRFYLTDMHRPILRQPGEWHFFLKFLQVPLLELVTYQETTIPLVLNRLWGWRDTTLDFYQLPLVTFRDKAGQHWSFSVEHFEVESQRWWFQIPVMPVARIIVKKIKISGEEASRRQRILAWTTGGRGRF